MLLPIAKVLQELEKARRGCIVVMLEANKEQAKYPPKVRPLLQEFTNVVLHTKNAI